MVREPAQKIVRSIPCPRYVSLCVVALLLFSPLQAAQVTNVIDNFTNSQNVSTNNVSTNNATATNTVAAAGAIGGFRTMILTASGDNTNDNTTIFVSATSQRLALNTPVDTTSYFQVRWGGAGGVSGLSADFGAGQPLDLGSSQLTFSLRSADLSSDFTWQFIDSSGNTATHGGIFNPQSSTDPPFAYNIPLASFTNSGPVNWNSINFIVFSGGGQVDMDMSLNAPFQVVASTIPEPATWALVVTSLALFALTLRSRSRN